MFTIGFFASNAGVAVPAVAALTPACVFATHAFLFLPLLFATVNEVLREWSGAWVFHCIVRTELACACFQANPVKVMRCLPVEKPTASSLPYSSRGFPTILCALRPQLQTTIDC